MGKKEHSKKDTEDKATRLAEKILKPLGFEKKRGPDFQNKREEQYVEVKGEKKPNPSAFRIYDSALKIIHSEKTKYSVWIIHNIWEKPQITIIPKRVIRKYLKISKQKKCHQILGISDIIEKERLSPYDYNNFTKRIEKIRRLVW
jgi:hypothetical protein